jgi:cysteine-rich repeat protein
LRSAFVVTAAAALWVAAVPIAAGAQVSAAGLDHPDLLDAFDRFKPEPGDVGGAGTASYADVFIGNEASGFAFFGGARGKLSGPDIDLVWFLFEPDKVTRGGTKISLSQKSQVGIAVPDVLPQAQPVEGCKAKVSLSGGPPPLLPQSAKWSFSCKKGALDAVEGLSSTQKAQLAALFGSEKLKLKSDGPRCGGVPNCGNGIVDCEEDCDTGGDSPTCDADCSLAVCGDGDLNGLAGEECDDGNTANGDGCDGICIVERCGNGVPQGGSGEECDDGNTSDGDGCDAICRLEVCGNGILQEGAGEECDDGNTVPGDGCSESCSVET